MIKLINKSPAEGMTLDVKELEQNFIKTRVEKFGETPEQAQELYHRCIMQVAAKVLPKAGALITNYLKAIE